MIVGRIRDMKLIRNFAAVAVAAFAVLAGTPTVTSAATGVPVVWQEWDTTMPAGPASVEITGRIYSDLNADGQFRNSDDELVRATHNAGDLWLLAASCTTPGTVWATSAADGDPAGVMLPDLTVTGPVELMAVETWTEINRDLPGGSRTPQPFQELRLSTGCITDQAALNAFADGWNVLGWQPPAVTVYATVPFWNPGLKTAYEQVVAEAAVTTTIQPATTIAQPATDNTGTNDTGTDVTTIASADSPGTTAAPAPLNDWETATPTNADGDSKDTSSLFSLGWLGLAAIVVPIAAWMVLNVYSIYLTLPAMYILLSHSQDSSSVIVAGLFMVVGAVSSIPDPDPVDWLETSWAERFLHIADRICGRAYVIFAVLFGALILHPGVSTAGLAGGFAAILWIMWWADSATRISISRSNPEGKFMWTTWHRAAITESPQVVLGAYAAVLLVSLIAPQFTILAALASQYVIYRAAGETLGVYDEDAAVSAVMVTAIASFAAPPTEYETDMSSGRAVRTPIPAETIVNQRIQWDFTAENRLTGARYQLHKLFADPERLAGTIDAAIDRETGRDWVVEIAGLTLTIRLADEDEAAGRTVSKETGGLIVGAVELGDDPAPGTGGGLPLPAFAPITMEDLEG